MVPLLLEDSVAVPYMLHADGPYRPATPHRGIHPREVKIVKTRTQMFPAALFTMVPKQKQPECPSANEWINQMWHLHTPERHSAIKRSRVLVHATA